MSDQPIDCAVIGAGVVGLAVARALALSGRDVVVLEAENAIGTQTSSRNSEVIHAGIYYPPGSLKARFCVEGKAQLYAYCASHGVAHRAIGKVMVASAPGQLGKLQHLHDNARACGVDDLQWLDAAEIRRMEPELHAVAGLFSPGTGIIDSHALMLALQGDLEAAGGVIAFKTPVKKMAAVAGRAGIRLETGGETPMALIARSVVNAAGLHAPALYNHMRREQQSSEIKRYFAKGHYFSLSGGTSPFRHLVYPMPEAAGLGIHATIDLGGQVKFGPDVEWIDTIDYAPDPTRLPLFEAAIRRYWPGLPGGALQPAYTGIRPKLVGPGVEAADFVIADARDHGVAGLIHLMGIESPGLTSALAIAEHVASRLERA